MSANGVCIATGRSILPLITPIDHPTFPSAGRHCVSGFFSPVHPPPPHTELMPSQFTGVFTKVGYSSFGYWPPLFKGLLLPIMGIALSIRAVCTPFSFILRGFCDQTLARLKRAKNRFIPLCKLIIHGESILNCYLEASLVLDYKY
jgi:hypothetical protein